MSWLLKPPATQNGVTKGDWYQKELFESTNVILHAYDPPSNEMHKTMGEETYCTQGASYKHK